MPAAGLLLSRRPCAGCGHTAGDRTDVRPVPATNGGRTKQKEPSVDGLSRGELLIDKQSAGISRGVALTINRTSACKDHSASYSGQFGH